MFFKLFTIFIISSASMGLELRFCYEFDTYYPFTNKATETNKQGIIPDIVAAAAAEVGVELVTYRASWKRCLMDFKNGTSDVIAAAIWSKERDEWSQFPKINGQLDKENYLWKADYLIHQHIESPQLWDGEKFIDKNLKISAPEGYIAYKKLAEAGVLNEEKLKADQGMLLVQAKRIDGYIVEALIGRNIIKRLGIEDKIVPAEKPYFSSLWYAPLSKKFSKKYPSLSEKFLQSVGSKRKELKEKLLKKYGVSH
ncbi:ABC transporter substrate-binding protein [Halobacteriovorax sp. HLS]|uniref:substrate-binding periplasmic protein n=1 Tax=Halobacteriovorax sp. HLS TaxID=2234000 RepID=UPI000FD71033|nr:transporter substrate-binding domain-containing protein [Halobacteriovorax sp. HLS]